MWNNQLSTVISEKLISYARWHGNNYIIPNAYRCSAPTGEDSLSSKIKVVAE